MAVFSGIEQQMFREEVDEESKNHTINIPIQAEKDRPLNYDKMSNNHYFENSNLDSKGKIHMWIISV